MKSQASELNDVLSCLMSPINSSQRVAYEVILLQKAKAPSFLLKLNSIAWDQHYSKDLRLFALVLIKRELKLKGKRVSHLFPKQQFHQALLRQEERVLARQGMTVMGQFVQSSRARDQVQRLLEKISNNIPKNSQDQKIIQISAQILKVNFLQNQPSPELANVFRKFSNRIINCFQQLIVYSGQVSSTTKHIDYALVYLKIINIYTKALNQQILIFGYTRALMKSALPYPSTQKAKLLKRLMKNIILLIQQNQLKNTQCMLTLELLDFLPRQLLDGPTLANLFSLSLNFILRGDMRGLQFMMAEDYVRKIFAQVVFIIKQGVVADYNCLQILTTYLQIGGQQVLNVLASCLLSLQNQIFLYVKLLKGIYPAIRPIMTFEHIISQSLDLLNQNRDWELNKELFQLINEIIREEELEEGFVTELGKNLCLLFQLEHHKDFGISYEIYFTASELNSHFQLFSFQNVASMALVLFPKADSTHSVLIVHRLAVLIEKAGSVPCEQAASLLNIIEEQIKVLKNIGEVQAALALLRSLFSLEEMQQSLRSRSLKIACSLPGVYIFFQEILCQAYLDLLDTLSKSTFKEISIKPLEAGLIQLATTFVQIFWEYESMVKHASLVFKQLLLLAWNYSLYQLAQKLIKCGEYIMPAFWSLCHQELVLQILQLMAALFPQASGVAGRVLQQLVLGADKPYSYWYMYMRVGFRLASLKNFVYLNYIPNKKRWLDLYQVMVLLRLVNSNAAGQIQLSMSLVDRKEVDLQNLIQSFGKIDISQKKVQHLLRMLADSCARLIQDQPSYNHPWTQDFSWHQRLVGKLQKQKEQMDWRMVVQACLRTRLEGRQLAQNTLFAGLKQSLDKQNAV